MIAIICHDAGGAEILSSYVRHFNGDVLYVLEGPARKIFERKLGAIQSHTLEKAVRLSTSILCGTGWQSDLEFNALKLARSLKKHSAAFLDHWTNYRERFIRSGETCLPDELWVGDTIAENMARNIFPDLPVRFVENPYFIDIRQEFLAIKTTPHRTDAISVLYVCEPLREHGRLQFGDERYWGYVEEEALRYFLTNIDAVGKSVDRIVIRLHPSEPGDKYDWVYREFPLPIAKGGIRSLVQEIADCDVIVGCESMAMIIGLIVGKRVINCIPPGGKECALPHPEIESVQRLVTMAEAVQRRRIK